LEDTLDTQLNLNLPQHMTALARANRVRLARAELKRAIGRGEVDVGDVIRDCPWQAESMSLAELLTCQRHWGRTRARKLLQNVALSESKRVGTLSTRQRQILLAELARHRVTRPRATADSEPHGEHADHWEELAALVSRQKELAVELEQLTTRRDKLIRELSAAGASRRSVAEATALTVGRIQQIVANSP
jgi:hypothetical protein